MIPNFSKAQEFNPFYQNIVDNIDFELLQENLQMHEDFGIKQPGTEALNNEFEWLKSTYEDLGYTDIKIDTFNYSGSECYNLIVTKLGTKYPDQFVIIDGHYDSRNGPGTDDNGTGTAIVLESARLLKDITTDYSVRFIHFSVEEYGLIGSYHYVDHVVVPEDHQIRLVFNIDAVGGVNGMINNRIVCERDESYPNGNNAESALFTDTLSVLMEMYSSLETEISYAYATDYVPFMEEGYVITGLYEYNESPYAHSPNDILSNMDLPSFFEVAKGSVAASLYFSGAYNSMSLPENNYSKNISVYPNPSTGLVQIHYPELERIKQIKVVNYQGQDVLSASNSINPIIDLGSLSTGIYFLVFQFENSEPIVKKINKI